MFSISIGGVQYKFSLLFPAVFLIMLFVDSTGIAATGVLAAVIHECGHLTVLCMIENKPASVIVSLYGMRLVRSANCTMNLPQSLAVFAAGPLANGLSAALLFWMPLPSVYAWIHLILGCVNMLPVVPLDGGQMINILLEQTAPPDMRFRVMKVLGITLSCAMLSLGVAVCLYDRHNFTLLTMAMYISLLCIFNKSD